MTALSTPAAHSVMCLSLLSGRYLLPFEDIVFIEGQGNYTLFYCRDGAQILTSKSLSYYMGSLPAHLPRVHKSYFVNTHFVKSHDRAMIYLTDGRRIPISRRRQRAVRKTISGQSNF